MSEILDMLMNKAATTGCQSVLRDISIEDPVDVSEETAQHKFLQILLSLTAAVIALQKDLTLTKLGKLTDKLKCLHWIEIP